MPALTTGPQLVQVVHRQPVVRPRDQLWKDHDVAIFDVPARQWLGLAGVWLGSTTHAPPGAPLHHAT